jgi:DNA polymerase III subunit epsilon
VIINEIDQMNIEDASFVVLDFETVTPKGRPPEPIELAAVRIGPSFQVDLQFKVDWFIKPPEGAPITPFDTAQTGIRWEDVRDAPLAATVLQKLDSLLRDKQCVFVAQNARYEAAVISRFSTECPHVAAMSFVDTIALAKYLVPGLPDYKLNTLANHFSVPIPLQRHRALPDVEMTVHIFLRLLEIGWITYKIRHVIDLKTIAGIKTQVTKKSTQQSLFD